MSEYIVEVPEWVIDANSNPLFGKDEEIVRCKDCIYYAESPDPVDPGWPMYCEFTQQEMLGCNGFCAWGVRREEK